MNQICEKYADDVSKQIKELKRCVRESRKNCDIVMMGTAYCRISEVCHEEDDLHGMFENSLKAVTVLKDTDEYESLARAYFILGKAYVNQGNSQMSLVCDEQAYAIIKKSGSCDPGSFFAAPAGTFGSRAIRRHAPFIPLPQRKE